MTRFTTLLFAVIVFVSPLGGLQARAQALDAMNDRASPLDSGYRQMYNLDFNGAHATFQQWEQNYPDDPMGPVSDAAAYLFSEFDRLHVLEVDLFTDNQKFEKREKPVADPAIRKAFDSQLSKADQLAGQRLTHMPGDATAMFAQVLANGLRGDYLALVEKRNLAGLSYMKTGRRSPKNCSRLIPDTTTPTWRSASKTIYWESIRPQCAGCCA